MILSCKHTQPVTLPDSLIGWHAQWACVGVCTFVNLSAGVPCYLFSNACTRTAYDYISEALYAAMFTSVCVHRRVSAERWTTADKRVCISHSTLMQGGETSVQRRHFTHAGIEQWRLAGLLRPLCQSIIILAFFPQSSMSVLTPVMKFHGRSIQLHTDHRVRCCGVNTERTCPDTLGNFSL